MTEDVQAYEALCDALRPDVVEFALADFLRRGLASPFAWGSCDCALWVADWITERRGADPLAAYRGTYEDEAGAQSIVQARGGLVAFLDEAFRAAGLVRGRPEPGAVGVVGTLLGPAAMLCLGDGVWAGKAPRGLRTLRAAPLATWRV